MSFKQFFKVTIETFKPHKYKGLTQRTLGKSLLFFFAITFIYMLVISGVNTTRYITNLESTESGFSNLEKLDLKLDIKTEKPVILSNYPLIIIDSESNNTKLGKEDILLTDEKITKKLFFWEKSIVINEINIKSIIDKAVGNKFFLIPIIPFILIFIFIYLLIKYLLVSIVFAIIGTLFLMFGENKAKINEVIKASFYAIIIYYLGNIVSAVINLKYIGLICYSIFFVIILFLLKEDDRTNFENDPAQDEGDEGF